MKTLLLLLFQIAFINLCHSQVSTRHQIFNNSGPTDILDFVDINGDGLIDISKLQSGGFEAYINQGNNQYSSQGIFNFNFLIEDEEFNDYAFIDYDGDGDQDLIVVPCPACFIQKMFLAENVTGTSFAFVKFLSPEGKKYRDVNIIVNDFDADGDEDFAMTNQNFLDLEIIYFSNDNGDIELSEISKFPLLNFFFAFPGDPNNDGISELMVYGEGEISTYEFNQGKFDFINTLSVDFYKMKDADLNGDGFPDKYYTNNSKVSALYSDGEKYLEPQDYFSGTTCHRGQVFHDLDNDGDTDMIAAKCSENGLFYYENINGQFEEIQKISSIGTSITNIFIHDSNGNGIDDIFFKSYEKELGWVEMSNETKKIQTHIIAASVKQHPYLTMQADNDMYDEICVLNDDWIGLINIDEGRHSGTRTIYTDDKNRIQSCAFTDMDGDSDLDIIILFDAQPSPQEDTTMIWLENDNNKFSTKHLLISNKLTINSFLLEDFDKDGDDDIVLLSYLYSNSYYENDGNGNIIESQTIHGNGWIGKTIDINGDSWLDVLSWGNTGNTNVYLNDQNGGFEPRINVGTMEYPASVDAGDIDMDGDMDIIASDLHTKLEVYRNNSSTSFSRQVNLESDYGPILAVDFNYDGLTDYITTNDFQKYKNKGSFNFSPISPLGIEHNYSYVSKGRLNKNDHYDLVGLRSDTYSSVFLHEDISGYIDNDNDGYYDFEDCNDQIASYNPGAEEIPNNPFDENCDGIILIIDEDEDGYNSDEDCNDNDPEINPGAEEIPGNGIDENCDDLDVPGDIDGDGFLSDVDCNDIDPQINPDAYDIPANGIDEDCDGEDSPSTITSIKVLASGNSDFTDIKTIDMNYDGVSDILFAKGSGIQYIDVTEGYLYSEEITGPNDHFFVCATAADFNNDGLIDVVGSHKNPDEVLLYMGLEEGGFGDKIILTDELASDIEVGDIDNDGMIDIFYTKYLDENRRSPRILFNDGDLNFTLKHFGTIWTFMNTFEIFDINGDGDIDLFYGNQAFNRSLKYYENKGNRSFSSTNLLDDYNNPIAFAFMDHNDDGNIDLITTARIDDISGIYVFYFDGASFSESYQLLFEVPHRMNLNIIEVDNDCDLDFVSSHELLNNMYLEHQTSPDVYYSERVKLTDAIRIDKIEVGDVSGDGKKDIIAISSEQNRMLIITNRNEPLLVDTDEDGEFSDTDCDDCNHLINNNNEEIPYNGYDDDCNAETLDDDLDEDGFTHITDCDDTNPNINPQSEEIAYNGIDDDCNPDTPDNDLDNDGYLLVDDCDDNNPDINPGIVEIEYNGINDDCNPSTPDDDIDQDGFLVSEDCDDNNSNINPLASEIPNNDVDENCDGIIEIIDEDMDGFNSSEDCDDNDPNINPGEIEIYGNDVDENCDGIIIPIDFDNDGYLSDIDCDDLDSLINPAAYDIPGNDIDEDCDGIIKDFTISSIDSTYIIEGDAVDVELVDMDGDSIQDVLYCSGSQIAYISVINQYKKTSIEHNTSKTFTYINAGDLDNDGFVDIVVSTKFNLYRMMGMPDGQFGELIEINDKEVRQIEILDIDNNGWLDIAYIYRAFNNKLGIVFNLFDSPETYVHSEHWPQFNSLVFNDYDNDGDLDAFQANSPFNQSEVSVSVNKNIGGKYFLSKDVIHDEESAFSMVFDDYDKDGDDDLIASIYSSENDTYKLMLFLLEDNEYLEGKTLTEITTLRDLAIIDLDNDCDNDYMLCTYPIEFVHRIDDSKYNLEVPNITAGFTILHLEVGDINGDLKKDIVFTRENSFSIVTNLEPNLPVITDLDGDGYVGIEDCDDCDSNINAGAIEIPNNNIDENCDGIIEIINSIHEENNSSIIFPNPNNGLFFIKSKESISNVELYDLSGRLINDFGLQESYNISEYKTGVYFLKLIFENGNSTYSKIIKY